MKEYNYFAVELFKGFISEYIVLVAVVFLKLDYKVRLLNESQFLDDIVID